MAFQQLIRTQIVPATVDEVWDFICSPSNLKKITPAHMAFEMLNSGSGQKMYPGMIIRYRVRPLLGIPLTWVSEITQVVEKRMFIDEQRVGPYAMWHHQHLIEPVEQGVLMTDIVSYKPPLGILGTLANTLFIKKQLERIFSYRQRKLAELFPGDSP